MGLIDDIKKTLTSDLTTLVRYLPVAIPENEQDKKILDIGLDMFKCMINDINNGQISSVVDISSLMQDWSELRPQLSSMNDKEVYDIISQISDACEEVYDED